MRMFIFDMCVCAFVCACVDRIAAFVFVLVYVFCSSINYSVSSVCVKVYELTFACVRVCVVCL